MSYSDTPGPDPNPYQSPMAYPADVEAGEGAGEAVATPRLLAALRQTRPWVRFLSILGFILCGFMLLAGLFGSLAMAIASGFEDLEPLVLLIYVPFGLLYLVPSLYLFRYASRIRAFESSLRIDSLESALEAQKSFWRFIGILMVVILAFYAIVLAIVMIVAIAGLVASG